MGSVHVLDSAALKSLLFVILYFSPCGSAYQFVDYDKDYEWYKKDAKCGLHSQSPVFLADEICTKDLGLIDFEHYDKRPTAMYMLNNGHTVVVDFSEDVEISGGGLPGKFISDSLHFHWGAPNEIGVEHDSDNYAKDMEVHIVHSNKQCKSQDECMGRPDGIAVLAVLFEVRDYDNPMLEEITSKLPNIKHPGQQQSIAPFAIRHFLPNITAAFIRYNGSLTTPPCDESVTWTIFMAPNFLSLAQLEKFRALRSPSNAQNGSYIIRNHRSTQRLNGRKLLKSVCASADLLEPSTVLSLANLCFAWVLRTLIFS